MKIEAYKLRSFNGLMVVFVIEQTPAVVWVLRNQVNYIHYKAVDREVFERDYGPVELTNEQRRRFLQGFKEYAVNVGMSSGAALMLPRLVAMTKEEVKVATDKGQVTEGKILEDAAELHAKDGGTGKAPRKLAGAALLAKQRKEAREAEASLVSVSDGEPIVEAVSLAEEPKARKPRVKDAELSVEQVDAKKVKRLANKVSKDQTKREAAGTKDARLRPPPKEERPGYKEPKPKQPPKAKPEPKAKDASGRVPRQPKLQANKGVTFELEKTKKADGSYRSSSAMMKALIFEGKHKGDDKKLFAAVQKQFPELGDDKLGYVAWNRGWFARNGIALA